MKKLALSLLLGWVMQAALEAQPALPQPVSAGTNSNPSTASYTVLSRDANSRLWGRVTNRTNDSGQVSFSTNRSYTELATGLCRFDTDSNAWVDADPTISITATGAAATLTSHPVTFQGDAAAAGGAVSLTAADGSAFTTRLYGLAYWDSATGSNALIGSLQPAQGTLVGTSETVYSNVISGPVTADLEYFNTLAGLEQYVVLKTALPAPDAYGLNDDTTMLQVWTAFLSSPEPQISAVTNTIEDDAFLDFGAMKIAVGKAFYTTNGQGLTVPVGGSRVLKRWVNIAGTNYLIEQLPYEVVSNAVINLPPPHASTTKPGAGKIKNTAKNFDIRRRQGYGGQGMDRMLVAKGKEDMALTTDHSDNTDKHINSGPMRLAQAAPGGNGFCIDYTLVGTPITNYVFQGGSTFYVSGTVLLYGTNIFEPGVVVKYTNSSAARLNLLDWYGGWVFNGQALRPSVFSDANDDSVGDTISGSTGTPSTGTATYVDSDTANDARTFSHARFSYAGTAYYSGSSQGTTICKDCQFMYCTNGLLFDNSDRPVYLQNVLASQCGSVVVGDDPLVFCEQVTADACTLFASGTGAECLVTNSIFTAIAGGTNFITIEHSLVATNGTGIYQTVGAGSYYLTNGSPARGTGTTNIDSALLAELRTLTTHPPVVFSNATISVATNFGIAAPRETNAPPDMGYAYDPLDYCFGGTAANANITFLPGVAAGWFRTSSGWEDAGYGIYMANSTVATFQGTEEAPVWWVRANVAQEGSGNAPWQGGYGPGGLEGGDDDQYGYDISVSPVANLTFTRCSMLADGEYGEGQHFRDDWGYLIVRANHSEFYGGWLLGYIISCNFTNCLFDRMSVGQIAGWTSDQWTMQNCTFHGGALYLEPYANAMPITNRDCAFDGTAITAIYYATNTGNAYYNYNGFTNSSVRFPVGGANDVIVTNGFNWQTSWLGNFYLPSSSALINAGDVTADQVGLYHFTTQTSQVPETNSTVDIGYHYVATDTNGNALDTDGTGVPDYIQDSNGDGVYDAGDVANWLNPFTIYDQGVSYGGFYPPNVRLGYWKFDNTSYTNQAGHGWTYSNYLADVADWSGNAVSLTNLNSSLQYNLVESNGFVNFSPGNGTIRFWFQPDWSSPGTGLPAYATFFQAGDDGVNGNWGFYMISSGTNAYLTLTTASNGYTRLYYFQAPVSFQSNDWYQIALAYSPTNVALYTNGALLTTANSVWPPYLITNSPVTNPPVWTVGNGLWFYPSASFLAGQSFSFGNNLGRPGDGLYVPADGQLDELETFNYPLTAEAVAAGYPTFAGNATNVVMADTNYVGRSDMLQKYVDGSPASVAPCRLGYWRFDSPLLFAEQGQVPISQSGVTLSNSWSGTAANIGSASGSELTYPDVWTNGWANINCRQGSLRFWFKPNWSSGGGPGHDVPFVYMGDTGPLEEWGLWVDSTGSTITLVTQTNGGGATTPLSASCTLTNSRWTQIVLTYGPTNSTLYINGTSAATGSGVSYWPRASIRSRGMVIGNTTAYGTPINGQFEEMETFNYQLTASEISSNFNTVQAVDTDLDGVPDLLEDIHLSASKPFLGAPVVITGTIEAEQFDQGGPGIAYSNNVASNAFCNYRDTGMYIANCDDSEPGYCLDHTTPNEWAAYTINVLVPGIYTVETRVEGIATNGTFKLSFATNGVTYTNTGTLTIPTNVWTNVAANVALAAGTNVMTLTFLSDGSGGSYVGRFNYISIYPYLPVPAVGTATTNVTLTSSTPGDYATASNNAVAIQNAVNYVTASGGGVVVLPSGTNFVAQTSPNEANDAYANAAVSILGNNIEIKGAGETTTTLIAYNRATTIFSLGDDKTGLFPAQCTNFTLRDMTIEAQPHRAVTNVTSTVYNPGQIFAITITTNITTNTTIFGTTYVTNYTTNDLDTGALTILYGVHATVQFAHDILVTNCQFLDADRSIVLPYYVSNLMVRACNFIPTGGFDTWGDTNVYSSQPETSIFFEVGIMGRNDDVAVDCFNLVVLENTYNGNSLITTTNTNTALPVTAADFVDDYSNWVAPDGLVWFPQAGNVFVARNIISNNALEAVQLNSGPGSVVGNTFYTLVNDGNACALNNEVAFLGLDATNTLASSISFIGNWVYGERFADLARCQLPSVVNVSGNWLNLSPVQPLVNPNDSPGAVAEIEDCQTSSVLGNTLVTGGHGVTFGTTCTNALIMDNDFSGATYRAIGYMTQQPGNSLPNAQVFRNILGEGVSYHAEINNNESFGWFFNQNTNLNDTNVVTPFFDPASSAAHVSN